MSEVKGLSRAQAAYDAMEPSDGGECPECVAEEWRQRVLSMLDDAPMSKRDRALYADRLAELGYDVSDDVRDYIEREDGEPCGKHKPKREDYD